MAYMGQKYNSRVEYDPKYPDIYHRAFKKCNWTKFCQDAKEAIFFNAPEPRGKEVDICMFVDSDDAVNSFRSRSGFFIYINTTLVQWYSKRKSTVKISVFRACFVAMKLGTYALKGLRFKFKMMGIPTSAPSYIYGDNMSVVYNTSRPMSVLKKKSNSVCYQSVHESVMMGEFL